MLYSAGNCIPKIPGTSQAGIRTLEKAAIDRINQLHANQYQDHSPRWFYFPNPKFPRQKCTITLKSTWNPIFSQWEPNLPEGFSPVKLWNIEPSMVNWSSSAKFSIELFAASDNNRQSSYVSSPRNAGPNIFLKLYSFSASLYWNTWWSSLCNFHLAFEPTTSAMHLFYFLVSLFQLLVI